MYQKKLGSTGLFVSELCLGTMTFGGGAGMWRQIGALDQTEAGRLVGRALDAGINFIDTADVYAEGSRSRSPARPCATSRSHATASSSPPRATGRWGRARTPRAPRACT